MGVRRRLRRGILLVAGIFGGVAVFCLLLQNGYGMWEPAVTVGQVVYPQNDLPMQVPGTTLAIHNLVRYEGGYLEDRSDIHVTDIAAILLENTGSAGIECARVILHWEDGDYVFDVTMLPPGMRVIVLEKDGQTYRQHPWTGCSGVQKTGDGDWSAFPVQIAVLDDTKLQLQNTTDMPIRRLQIYYKNYLPDDRILLGGVAYCYLVDQIPAGQSVTVEPYRFAWGYSKIVQITCQHRNDD